MGIQAWLRPAVLALAALPGISACSPAAAPAANPAAPTPPAATPPVVTGVAVTCASASFTDVGQTSQCRATAAYSDGSSQEKTADAQWSSSAASRVTVSSSGLVTAVAAGDAEVTATYQGASGRQAFQVSVPDKPCDYQLASATSLSFDERGGSGVIDLRVTQGTNCGWTATTLGGVEVLDASGVGSAGVRFVVPSYASATTCSRDGVVRIRGNGAPTELLVRTTQRDHACGLPGFTSVQCGGGRAGEYVPLACYVVVKEGTDPRSPISAVSADKTAFGGTSQSFLVRCVACGEPGYELDLTIPAAMAPGSYPIRFSVTDAMGRIGTAVATFVVR